MMAQVNLMSRFLLYGINTNYPGALSFVRDPTDPSVDVSTLEDVMIATKLLYEQAVNEGDALVQHRAAHALRLQQTYYDTYFALDPETESKLDELDAEFDTKRSTFADLDHVDALPTSGQSTAPPSTIPTVPTQTVFGGQTAPGVPLVVAPIAVPSQPRTAQLLVLGNTYPFQFRANAGSGTISINSEVFLWATPRNLDLRLLSGFDVTVHELCTVRLFYPPDLYTSLTTYQYLPLHFQWHAFLVRCDDATWPALMVAKLIVCILESSYVNTELKFTAACSRSGHEYIQRKPKISPRPSSLHHSPTAQDS